MKMEVRWVTFFLGMWLYAVSAGAVSWEPMSLPAMVQQADVVALTHVVAERSFWREGRIYTVYTMQVDESYVGSVSEDTELQVETWGGVVGSIGQKVAGALALSSSEQQVVFLHAAEKGVFRSVGMAQGVFYLQNPFMHDASSLLREEVVHTAAVRAVPSMPSTLGALKLFLKKARSHEK